MMPKQKSNKSKFIRRRFTCIYVQKKNRTGLRAQLNWKEQRKMKIPCRMFEQGKSRPPFVRPAQDTIARLCSRGLLAFVGTHFSSAFYPATEVVAIEKMVSNRFFGPFFFLCHYSFLYSAEHRQVKQNEKNRNRCPFRSPDLNAG